MNKEPATDVTAQMRAYAAEVEAKRVVSDAERARDLASSIVSTPGFGRLVAKAIADHAISHNTGTCLSLLLNAAAALANCANFLDDEVQS